MDGDFVIHVDDTDVQAALRNLSSSDVKFVTAYALTKTAQDIQSGERQVMSQVFDRPTPFTLNALFVKPATKTDLTAVVGFKDPGGSVPAWRYLGPEVEGGARKKKSFERALERAGILRSDEYAVPGKGVKLDQYGNLPGSTFTQILSQIQASADPTQNMTDRSRKRAVGRAGGRYILLRPEAGDASSRVYGRAAAGIYLRTGARSIVPVLVFVRAPTYSKRFQFYEVAQQVFNARFYENAKAGWAVALGYLKRAA